MSKAFLTKQAHRYQGETWDEVALKLSRLGYWEFEDYQPYKGFAMEGT